MSKSQTVLERADAISNTLAGLGSTLDKDRANRVGTPYVLSRGELDILYEYNHYAARIVDKPATECMRRGFKIVIEDLAEDPFADLFADLRLADKMVRADKWSRLYGGAAVVLGVEDGQKADQPIALERVRRVAFARVVDMYELTPATWVNEWTDERFGEVETYNLSPMHVGGATENIPNRIHADRILRFAGVELPRQLSALVNYWGDSNLQRCWNAIARFGGVEADVGNLVHQFNVGVWKMKGLADTLSGPGGEALFLERLIAASQSLSLLNSMALDAENEDYSRVGSSTKGVADLYDRLASSLAAAAEMSLTMLFGETPSGLSTDDKAGRRWWYDLIGDRQERVYGSPIRQLVDLFIASSEQRPEGVEVDSEYQVEFLPLEEPNENELVEQRSKQAATDKIYFEIGALTAEEIRESRFGGTAYSVETTIDDDAIGRADSSISSLLGAFDDRIRELVSSELRGAQPSGTQPTDAMVAWFDERERRHISAVREGIDALLEAYEWSEADRCELRTRARTHDASKTSKAEQLGYVWNTHRYRQEALGRPLELGQEIRELIESAWQHHKLVNRHHPEFHESVFDMTDVDLAELAADWCAVSNENAGDALEWLAKEADRFGFSLEQRDRIESFIRTIDTW